MHLQKSFSGGLQAQSRDNAAIGGLLVMVGLGVIAGAATVFSFAVGVGPLSALARQLPEWVTQVVLLVCTIGGIGGMILAGALLPGLQRSLRSRRLAEPVLTLEATPRPGESFEVRYEIRAKRPVEITAITVSFLLREWVSYRSGSHTVNDTHDTLIAAHTLPGRHLPGGGAISDGLRFEVPATAIHTWSKAAWVVKSITPPAEFNAVRQRFIENPQRYPPVIARLTDPDEAAARIIASGIHHNTLTYHLLFEIAIKSQPDYNQAWEVPVAP